MPLARAWRRGAPASIRSDPDPFTAPGKCRKVTSACRRGTTGGHGMTVTSCTVPGFIPVPARDRSEPGV